MGGRCKKKKQLVIPRIT